MTYPNRGPEFNSITWNHKRKLFVDKEGKFLTRKQAATVRWICRICNQSFSRKDVLAERKHKSHAY
jgi:hypothetical protein